MTVAFKALMALLVLLCVGLVAICWLLEPPAPAPLPDDYDYSPSD